MENKKNGTWKGLNESQCSGAVSRKEIGSI
jgi:hypothetical protein